MTNSTPKAAGLDAARIVLILAVVGVASGILIIGAAVLSFVWADWAFPMTVDSEYADRTEAEADNLFGRGWMPRDMPATMNDIQIRTDLDISIAWATFRTDASGIEDIRSRFKLVPTGSVKLLGNPGTPWWPSELKDGRALSESALKVYACGERAAFHVPAFLAIDANTHKVYYWQK